MKHFKVKLITTLIVEGETANEAIELVRESLGEYWLSKDDFTATEVVDDNPESR